MGAGGFVNQAYRDMVNWRFYHDVPVRILFDYMLRIAALEEHVDASGVLIPAGGMLAQVEKLAKDNALTVAQIRLALKKLIVSNEITMTFYSKRGSLIVINQWDKYRLGALSQNAPKSQSNDTQIASKSQPYVSNNQEDTNETKNQNAPKSQSNDTQIAPKEKQENEEIPPIPLKEDKEKKEHTSSCACVCEDAPDGQQQLQLQLDGMTDKASVPQSAKKTSGKPKANKLTYNKQTHKIEGITKEDIEKWRQMFPYLDIEAEIENEEEYLARPKRKYTDIRRTFENHLKTQQYPPPPNADEVMRIGMERKLDITLEMATHFFNKHQASGWRNEQWKPILDWRCLLENFVATWNQNHYGPQIGNFSQSTYGRPTESKPFDPSKYEN